MRPGGIRRQPAGAGNFSRIHQHGPGRDFDAAGQLGIVELHADGAALGAQPFQQKAPDARFDFADGMRKGFVAALGANGEIRKLQRRYLFPGGLAERVEIVARSALQAGERPQSKRCPERAPGERPPFPGRFVAEFDHHAVTRLAHAHVGEIRQRPAKGNQKFTQKKLAVPALEPEFVVMNDDDRS